MPHLLVFISAHGFGHVAQTAPILNQLRATMPDLQLTISSDVSLEHLKSRIVGPFNYLRNSGDIGMLMSSALDVKVEESAYAYQALHREWGMAVRNQADLLKDIAPDFVLSNVGYLPLAGAHHADIPSAALCSLNWLDIFAHYCSAISGAHLVIEQIRHSYANAGAFLALTPGMPMASLPNRIEIGPVAEQGINRRDEINKNLSLSSSEKLVLVSMGGIAGRLPVETWPKIDGVRWLVQAAWHVSHPNAVVIESLEISFSDVLASSDALICKPGYGSFVEAACVGLPVLYVRRQDWPEAACLEAWLKQYGCGAEMTRQQLEQGDIQTALMPLLYDPRPVPVAPSGTMQVTEYLASRLLAVN